MKRDDLGRWLPLYGTRMSGAERDRRYRARQKHGTPEAYDAGCRCEVCTDAQAEREISELDA